MWGLFFLSILLAALFLYLPGFLLLRTLRFPALVGVACAPFVTIVVYGIMSIVYARVGIFCSWVVLVLPTVGVALLLWLASVLFWRAKSLDLGCEAGRKKLRGISMRSFDWLCFALYLVLGIGISLFVLAKTLDGPDSFVQEFDNVYHLGAIRGFVDAGNWSSLDVSLYPSAVAASFNPLEGAEYYPAAWHGVAALIVSSLDAPVTLAANAANFTFTAIVFPSGMFLLMRRLLSSKPRAVLLGSLCTLAFASFPWGYLIFGPLYSNLSSFAILPAVTFCFISMFAHGIAARSRIVVGGLFVVGIMGLVLTQPNAVFTMAVFLIPFCIYQIAQGVDRAFPVGSRRTIVKIGLSAAFLALAAFLWVVLFRMPFLQRVVTHNWPAFTGKSQVLIDAATLAFNQPACQIGLAIVVALGIAYTFYNRKFFWLSCSYALMLLIFIAGAAYDSPIKFLLSGFWYTDSYRTAASAAFFAIPLAGLGLMAAASALQAALAWVARKRAGRPPRGKLLSSCLAAAAFALLVFYPSYEIPGAFEVKTAFGSVYDRLSFLNDAVRPNVYSPEERTFVQEVKRIVPEGSLILNEPNDGTSFAYGVDGLNVYYRYLRTYGGDDESQDSKIIRNQLNAIAASEQVRSAVERIDAHYLLVLDQGDAAGQQPYLFTYQPEDWRGINAVDDDTPGFKVVLSEGDMRLYKIELHGVA